MLFKSEIIERQIKEVEELLQKCNVKTIEELLDNGCLSTMNYEYDMVDFNYKDITGTIYEHTDGLVVGESFEIHYNGNVIDFEVDYTVDDLKERLTKLLSTLNETDPKSAYVLEDIMKGM